MGRQRALLSKEKQGDKTSLKFAVSPGIQLQEDQNEQCSSLNPP